MGQLQITPEGYEEIKGKIKAKLNETTNNFIIIGYYLKQVRDNMLYLNDGYRNMEEFAQGEYRLSASTASRLMDINTRFSEGGNSMEIKEEYRNYGYSKLQEMLNVKEEDMQLITEDTTVKQIREIKAVEKAEDKAADEEEARNLPLFQMDREAAGEEKEAVATSQNEEVYSPIEQTLIAVWKSKPEELLSRMRNSMLTPKELAEELCPSGGKTFMNGTKMLLLYDYSKGVKLRYYVGGKINIEEYSYNDIWNMSHELLINGLFAEIMEQKKAEKKKEWETPVIGEKKVPEQKEKPQDPPAERKAEPEQPEETYKPLPGQTTIEDINLDEQDQSEDSQVSETVDTNMAAGEQPAIDAEYREVDQHEEKQEYTDIEIQNAIGYFETEYYRMTGTGLKESAKCRNYKMALEAIRKCYGKS